MRNLDESLIASIQRTVTTMSWCWRITRTDGVILGFTNFDQDLVIDGVTYSAATGFTPSAIASDSTMSVNNMELNSVLDDASITAHDLMGGLFDSARVDIFLVNYQDLPARLSLNPPKHLLLVSGILGEVKISDLKFSAEMRSLAQFLSQKTSNLTSKLCRYDLGDSKCTVNLAPYTHNLTVASVINSRTFTIDNSFNRQDGYFNYGQLKFTNGANNKISAMIATYTSRTIALFEPLPFTLQVGDTLVAIAGCRKTIQDCSGRYANILNYGGEPHVPGADTYFMGAV